VLTAAASRWASISSIPATSTGASDNERLIRDTLQPYPIGTRHRHKGRYDPQRPATPEKSGHGYDGERDASSEAVEGSLRDLGVERIDLYQLHRVDPAIPIEETMELLRAAASEGKIRHIGLSEVGVDEIERARSVSISRQCRTNTISPPASMTMFWLIVSEAGSLYFRFILSVSANSHMPGK